MTSRGETITMLDEDGLPHDFTLIDVVEVDDRRYAVLQPEDQKAGAVLFRLEGDTMAPVEDNTEFDEVVDVLRGLEEYDGLVIEDARDERGAGDDSDERSEEDDDEEDDDEEDDDW
jgi:putative Holliday junction resolvase